MKKRFLLKGLLASLMLLCAAYTWAYDFEAGNIQYTVLSLEDLMVEVSGLTDTNVTEVVIPSSVEYKSRTLTVTSIGGSAFYKCTSLNEVTIPNSVTSIGIRAFEDCSSLKEVTIPNSVESIGKYAFYKCTSLNEVTIPNSVTSIGSSAFKDCTSLAEITIPNAVTSIESCAFQNCSSLKEVTIPNSVESIGNEAFYKCTSLNEVTIPNSVTSIGIWAFEDCTSLKVFDIPNSVISLGSEVLVGCAALQSLYVGTGLSYLLEYLSTKTYGDNHTYYNPLLWSSGPTEMESIILEDDASSFSMRGHYEQDVAYPIFSNIEINYFYVGRPLIDIQTWTYSFEKASGGTYTQECKITTKQPYGVIENLEIGGYCTEVPYFYQSVENLILGDNVEKYTVSNIYQGELTSITCKSTMPPTLTGTFDTSTYVRATLYVPIGSKSTYESTEGWKDFWEIIETNVSGIDGIVNSGEVTEVARYTLSGQKITTPQKGINIVHYSDGSTRKILVQ